MNRPSVGFDRFVPQLRHSCSIPGDVVET
jgi:hypothetical protein